jgi:hypothetical protein
MIFKKLSFLSSNKELKPKRFFKHGDVWVSMLELGNASFCISKPHFPAPTIAASMINLAHLITCLVLSDRLCWESTKQIRPGPHAYVPLKIRQYTKVACIDEFHPFTNDSTKSLDEYSEVLQPEIFQAVIRAAHTMFAEPKLKFDDEAKLAFLREYLLATEIMPIRYSPNPFYCEEIIRAKAKSSFLKKELPGKQSSEILLNIVKDLRNEVAEEYNTLREMDIYDINIPPIFSAVLKESRNTDDIFRVAKQMRREASEFRAWCRELDKADDPLIFLQGIADAKDALEKFCKIIRTKREERLTITLIPGLLKLQVPFTTSTTVEKILRNSEVDTKLIRPVAFLQNIHLLSRKVQQLESEIARVFPQPNDTATQIMQVLTKIIGK